MISYILSNRQWSLKVSFIPRRCYVSDQSLWLRLAYRGRKRIWSIIDNGYTLNDDIWISKEVYENQIGRVKVSTT